MNEIKFRAWVKEEKRYITDRQEFIPLIVTNKGVLKLQPQFEEDYYEILPMDLFEFEMSTGHHDKNGVEIFKGDIIEVKTDKWHFISEIEWDDSSAGFMFQDSNNTWCGMDALATFKKGKSLYGGFATVIGNIHTRQAI